MTDDYPIFRLCRYLAEQDDTKTAFEWYQDITEHDSDDAGIHRPSELHAPPLETAREVLT